MLKDGKQQEFLAYENAEMVQQLPQAWGTKEATTRNKKITKGKSHWLRQT